MKILNNLFYAFFIVFTLGMFDVSQLNAMKRQNDFDDFSNDSEDDSSDESINRLWPEIESLLDSEDEAFNDDASMASGSTKSGKSSSHQEKENKPEMLGLFKRESCCLICEDISKAPGDMVKCKGVCQNSFLAKKFQVSNAIVMRSCYFHFIAQIIKLPLS